MKNKITETLGWYGVVVILLAYALGSFDIISTKGVTYQLLNLIGASGLIADAIDDRDYQPLVLNAVWALVALVVLCRVWF